MLGEGHAVPIDPENRATYLSGCVVWADELQIKNRDRPTYASKALRALVEEVRRLDEAIEQRDAFISRISGAAQRVKDARKSNIPTEHLFGAQTQFMREIEFAATMDFKKRAP